MSITIKANGATKQLMEKTDTQLSTITSWVSETEIPAGEAKQVIFNFSIPSGWKYLGLASVWCSGNVLPIYGNDLVDLGSTGDIVISAWVLNVRTSPIKMGFGCKIIIQRNI